MFNKLISFSERAVQDRHIERNASIRKEILCSILGGKCVQFLFLEGYTLFSMGRLFLVLFGEELILSY